MVLSKGKKIILIAAIVIIALIAGFLFYQSYQDAKKQAGNTIEKLLDTSDYTFGGPNRSEPYNEEEPDDITAFIEEEFTPLRDKGTFQKELVSAVNETIEVSLYNETVDYDDHQTNRYSQSPLASTVSLLWKDFAGFLNQVGYEDEKLKDSFIDFYTQYAALEETAASSDSEQNNYRLTANNLSDVAEEVLAFNEAASDFYQISLEEVVSPDKIADYYTQSLDMALAEGDRGTIAQVLSDAAQSPIVGDRTFIQPDDAIDLFLDDGGSVYTLKNGIGGYYDAHKILDSGQITYCGDFAMRTTTSGGNKYDTSELGGVWDALSPGQQQEILSGNRTETHYTYYLQGELLDDNEPNFSLAEQGYDYVYINNDGSVVHIAKDGISYHSRVIPGNFSELYAEMAEAYEESQTPELTPVEDEQYAPYTGIFGYDGNPCFQSEFQTDGTNVYWVCTPLDGAAAEGVNNFFKVQLIYGHSVDLFTLFPSPPLVQDMTATAATSIENVGVTTVVSFRNGIISYQVSYEYGGGVSGSYAKVS